MKKGCLAWHDGIHGCVRFSKSDVAFHIERNAACAARPQLQLALLRPRSHCDCELRAYSRVIHHELDV